jgi:hypothetical protein
MLDSLFIFFCPLYGAAVFGVLAPSCSYRMCYRGFNVGYIFIDRGGLLAPWIPAAFATPGLMLALLFIFIDPCAGRHSLSLLRQRK